VRALPEDDDWTNDRRRVIGDRIRETRLLRNLTQEKVLLAAQVSRSVYQQIEAGRSNPRIGTLMRIAWVLDVPLADLVRE
jgi:transcriptional regulator with XRE-family HTH domain